MFPCFLTEVREPDCCFLFSSISLGHGDCFAETSVSSYDSTRRNNPDGQRRRLHRREKLGSHVFIFLKEIRNVRVNYLVFASFIHTIYEFPTFTAGSVVTVCSCD